jgi:hypothetical protein
MEHRFGLRLRRALDEREHVLLGHTSPTARALHLPDVDLMLVGDSTDDWGNRGSVL